jgi:pyrroline-5-carboxylate reductase
LNIIKVAMSDFPSKICFFGCGNMGSAMLRGWLAAGTAPDTFHIVDPVAENLPAGVVVSRSAQDVQQQFDILLLGILPQAHWSFRYSLAPQRRPCQNLFLPRELFG